MRRTLGLMLALSVVGLTRAADTPKHNKLTPQEAAEGWISLFDGTTTFGWTAPTDSKWTIVEGMLAPQSGKPGLLVSTTAFADYDLKLQYRVKQDSKAAVLVNCDPEGKNVSEKEKVTQVQLRYQDGSWMEAQIGVRGGHVTNSYFMPVEGLLRFASRGVPSAGLSAPKQIGHLALEGHGVIFRDVRLKPATTKSLFNGKDLTGWKKYEGDAKRAKSVFAVSPERALTIKNGPGDLQTDEQWSDFILQIECKTNGKNLNSGVFFRCRPGEYQNGYEAQIHNGWSETPKDYVVEEFDPKTHEPKDKHKVKSLALDYGTGAIYRRVPARQEVAKDGEWFTMTVAAQGNHLATWVNGVQVTDWTDNRPVKDNARNGCKLEKGPISLQGHDPTTDLAFRNIRIEDLTPKTK